jgi:formylglycine-generating enzyme required for sulfatase activity
VALPEEISAGLLPHVSGYEVLCELGRGGMGVVYRARQVGLDRMVALKVLLHASHAGSELRSRFVREARAVARLQHPNIVAIYEIDEVEGLPFFSMEYCPGGSLARQLSKGPLEPREAATLLRALALAMQAAHDAQVIHRDLKPANILLAADGTPKVADFGLAKKLDQVSQTATGAVLGTPLYMAPEQAQGKTRELGPWTDVYALGTIFYECLTGRPPFCGDSPFETMLWLVARPPVRPRLLRPELPAELEAICLHCLQKEPEKRPVSARQLAEMLDRFLAGQAHPEPKKEGTDTSPRRRRLRPLLVGALCLLILSVPVAAWLAINGWPAEVESSTEPEPTPPVAVAKEAPIVKPPDRPGPPVPPAQVRPAPPPPAPPVRPAPPPLKDFVNSIGMKLVRIAPGKFFMGSARAEQMQVLQLSREDETKDDEAMLRGEQQHEVQITRPFFLGIHEVTQAQYEKVVGSNPSHFSPTGDGKDKIMGDTGKLPVEMVSWYDAVRFCEKLSERKEEKAAGRVYRLPTEAEWEYACRAGTRTIFHTGDTLSSLQANFVGTYPFGAAEKGPDLEQTSPVGSYKPNAFGLYDMHGNVQEWCADLFGAKFYQTAQARRDPKGPASGMNRVVRGGSWYAFPKFCRSAYRNHYAPDSRFNDFGFRVACDVAAP